MKVTEQTKDKAFGCVMTGMLLLIPLNVGALLLGCSSRFIEEAMNTQENKDEEVQVLGSPDFQDQEHGIQAYYGSTMEPEMEGVDYSGYTRAPGVEVDWRSDKATPDIVLRVLIHRMTYLQGTPMASNQNAKALYYLEKAMDEFRGNDTGALGASGE